MGFWNQILDSLAKKFDSVLNRPFENKFTWSLFTLGSLLITSSMVYSYTADVKAELKNNGISFIFNFASGPEIIPTIIGSLLIGFSIAIFWKTKIPKTNNTRSDFHKLVEKGIDSFSDYEIQKSFKAEFNYLAPVTAIKLILKLEDSLSKFFDYKKARSHIDISNDIFSIKKPKKLNLISVISTFFYFIFAFLAMASLQLIIWSIKTNNSSGILTFSVLFCCLTAVSITSLNTYSETAAARRLSNTV
ncbi:hypothetical protein [Psychromonas sp. KJ10-2]|uniref:hypothetical protein n=1 Tax=Psychromonas sp. KJ10-2 TaxID=3391822 RepID=UPI0039B5E625